MPVRVPSQNPINIDSICGAAVSALTRMLPAPPHLPNVALVGKRALQCIEEVEDSLPVPIPIVSEVLALLSEAVDQVTQVGTPPALLGLHSDFPAWAWLGSPNFPQDELTHGIVGRMLVVSLLRGEHLDKTTVKQLKSIHLKKLDGRLDDKQFEKQLQEIHGRASRKFMTHVEQASSSQDRAQLTFNVGVLGTLVNRLSSLRRKERQAAGGDQSFSPNELNTCIYVLLRRAESGEVEDLAKLVCFCMGLGWDIGKSTPFIKGEDGQGNLAWIDPISGWMYVDLNPVLKDLGKKPDPRHEPTSMLLRRPLPTILANLLHDAYVDNPALKTVEGLLEKISTSRKKISLQEVHHSASIAQLMRSARSAALACIERREIAAFSTLGFELISKSDLHYISPKEVDIWQGCEALYSSVGLGTAVPFCGQEAGRIGSRLTPSAAWVQDIFQESKQQVEQTRCGRRYALQSIVDFHNAYARHVGLVMQLNVGGRDRRDIKFLASAWSPGHAFGLHEDKPLGATRSRTPIPISPQLAEQLRLWQCHLPALCRRLEKLNAPGYKAVDRWVRSIQAGQEVPLLFTLDGQGLPQVLTAAHVFSGQASDINRDFGRHFVACHLSDRGLFGLAQDWLRHYAAGASSFEVTSMVATQSRLIQLMRAIDELLISHDIKPITGLSKG